jgi:hypothetical protein
MKKPTDYTDYKKNKKICVTCEICGSPFILYSIGDINLSCLSRMSFYEYQLKFIAHSLANNLPDPILPILSSILLENK